MKGVVKEMMKLTTPKNEVPEEGTMERGYDGGITDPRAMLGYNASDEEATHFRGMHANNEVSEHSRQRQRRNYHSRASSSDGESDNGFVSSDVDRRRSYGSQSVKLPPFTGKEQWHVWYNRFIDVDRKSVV